MINVKQNPTFGIMLRLVSIIKNFWTNPVIYYIYALTRLTLISKVHSMITIAISIGF